MPLPTVGRRFRTLALFVLCVVIAIPAAARDWHISRFATTMTVSKDGTAQVLEHLDVVFDGEYHGIYRDIPIQYPGPNGSNYTLFLKVTGVTDGHGHNLKYDSSVRNGSRHLKIYIPDAVDATRTVDIRYNLTNAVRWFDGYDELYWNVTGNDWPVPIDSAMAVIIFPQAPRATCARRPITGTYGSRDQNATVVVGGDMVRVTANDTLAMREGLTADVYISKGVLTQPSKLTQAMWFLRSNPIVLLPLWALIVMFFFWWTKGRDPKPDISVAPMYEPPKDMTPAEVGTLMDDTVHPRDITSTLVDLAVKGYIKIEETESKVLLFSHRDYTFHLVDPQPKWSTLAGHEQVMLNHMFQGGATQIRLSDLRNQFYVAIPTLKSDILALLKSKGMYSVDPDSAHAYVVAGVVITALPFVIAQLLGLGSMVDAPGLLVAAALIAVSDCVPVRAHYAGEIAEGRAHQGRDSGLPGIRQSRGCGPAEAYAARHLRKVSALCHGAGHRESLGQSV